MDQTNIAKDKITKKKKRVAQSAHNLLLYQVLRYLAIEGIFEICYLPWFKSATSPSTFSKMFLSSLMAF